MKRFILAERNGIYIIDLHQSLTYIDQAYALSSRTRSARAGQVLFRRHERSRPRRPSQSRRPAWGCPTVNQRWLGGMLTNFPTMLKRIQKLKELES